MSIHLRLPKVTDLRPRITVVGVGGAGGNAVNNMIAAGLTGVNFIVANTDAQALANSSSEHRLQLGTNLTEGLGAGSKPEIGEAAAEEAVEDIRSAVVGSHMLFIAAGMGGGTGTGAAAVIARVARELGILTVAVVTKPFLFEGQRRARIADAGIAQLKGAVDTLIVIPNQNLFRITTEQTTFAEAFVLADQVLYSGIACIVDLIIKEGLINLDLADVKTVLQGMGSAMMGTGEASGDNRAKRAAEEAINNPLLDDVRLRGAKGLLVSIVGGRDLTLHDVDAAASRVRAEVDPEANIIVGATFDDSLGDRVRVSIVASGLILTDEPTSAEAPVMSGSGLVGRMPPPLPSGAAGAASLDRKLAAIAEPGRGRPMGFDGLMPLPTQSPQPKVAKPGAIGDSARQAVVIEERPPQMPAGPTPRAESLSSSAVGGRSATHRGDDGYDQSRNNRIPPISEFPPIAQSEYNARQHTPGAHPPQVKAAKPYSRDDQEGTKKIGLLRRLTGGGRRRKDDEEVALSQGEDLPGFLVRRKSNT